MVLQNGDSANGDDELQGWSVDTSEKAVKSRMEKLTDGATALALTDDLEKSSSERLDIFYKFVEVSKNSLLCFLICFEILRISRRRVDLLVWLPLCPRSRLRPRDLT